MIAAQPYEGHVVVAGGLATATPLITGNMSGSPRMEHEVPLCAPVDPAVSPPDNVRPTGSQTFVF